MDFISVIEKLQFLAWPIVVIFLFFWNRNEIKGLINRVNSGKLPGGIEFNAPISQSDPKEDVPPEIKKSIKAREEELAKNIDTSTSASRPELVKEIDKLVKENSAIATALFFERIYQLIFGSQIQLLDQLRSLGSAGRLYEDISAYYQGVRLKFPNLNSYPLDNYISFLTNAGLIEFINTGQKRVYKIAPTGIDFLEYIEALNYPKIKFN